MRTSSPTRLPHREHHVTPPSLHGTRRAGSAVAALLCVFVWAGAATAGPSCDQATREVERTQQELSAAAREADARGVAYHACMQGGKAAACAAQKQAWEAAIAHRGRALEALRAARAAREQACR